MCARTTDKMYEQRDVLAEFSHLRDVALQVAELIKTVRGQMGPADSEGGKLELEARLGKINDKHFDSNIGHAAFCSILQMLESYPRWSRVSPWQETQDVFYTVELPTEYSTSATNGKTQIRTSVGVDTAGDVEIIHHTKERLRYVDMEMRLMDTESCNINVRRSNVDGFDVRVAASFEKPIPAEVLPIAVSPDTRT